MSLPEDAPSPRATRPVLTNKRLVIRLRTARSPRSAFGPAGADPSHSDGMCSSAPWATVLRFKSKSEDTCEIVGELLGV